MLDRIFEPILGGIFTADADRMSLEMTMPQLLRLERRHGSLYRAFRAERTPAHAGGKPRIACLSLRGGLGRLIDALVGRLPADWIETSTQVDHVSPVEPAGGWRLRFADRQEFEADAVVLACPSFTAGRLFSESDRELADDLARLEYAACATVNLAYPRAAVGRRLEGLGFFVGRAEGLPLLACSHVSIKYPDRAPGDQVLLRAFLGGARDPAVLRHDDEALRALAHDSLSSLLQIEGESSMFRVHRFPSSMPQFPVGFRRNIERLRGLAARRPGLILGGGSLGTVGLPDCIASGETAAGQALDSLSAVGCRSFPAATRA